MVRIHPLPYQADSAELFEKMAHLHGAIFLDSGAPHTQQGRYDILVALPTETLSEPFLPKPNQQNVLLALKQKLKRRSNPTNLPFAGGAVGFLSYDYGRRLECIQHNNTQLAVGLPALHFGLYECGIVVDHQTRTTQMFHRHSEQAELILEAIEQAPQHFDSFRCHSRWQAHTTRSAYGSAFQSIIEHIHAGDIYQANLAQCFSADVSGAPWSLYKKLRHQNPAPFSAFMQHDNWAILSTSPERLLSVQDRHVYTQPIKGTMPRGETATADQAFMDTLINCPKNRAENLMIVDLLRNDLSRTCLPNSVKVRGFCELHSFASVHHLISTITGELDQQTHALDVLNTCFPGGSITGAPKISAMQIIEALEPVRRQIYCGSMGYIGYNGNMDMNIAIRSQLWWDNTLYCYGGGAIVADSDEQVEYDESMQKISKLLQAVDPTYAT